MSKLIVDYIPKSKQIEYCDECYEICGYQCPIWRDAKAQRDKAEESRYSARALDTQIAESMILTGRP